MLRINYSSAKGIASMHKKNKITSNKRHSKKCARVCSYREIK